MVIIDLGNKDQYNIEPKTSRDNERMLCPKCSSGRRNKTEKCLAWNNKQSIGFCHNCQTSFAKPFEYVKQSNREYKRPEKINNSGLSDKTLKYFNDRGISKFTLSDLDITEGMAFMPQAGKEMNTIHFNYYRDGELINRKYRDGAKNFKFEKDAELIMYNIDAVTDDQMIIVEGEMDVLTLHECGFTNAVSVPNGANVGRNNFEYIDNCIELFDKMQSIIIATDNDIPGTELRTQLASRLGVDRCYKVNWKDCKDANEYLIKYGKEETIKVIQNNEAFPIDGAFTVRDIRKELDQLFEFGLKPGMTIGQNEFDEHLTFSESRLYTFTGIPGHGKSEFLDFIIERLNVLHGLRVAYFSPENHPIQLHASKIIEKLVGSRFSKKYIDPITYESVCEYMDDNYYFIEPPEDYKFQTILDKAKNLIYRYGVKILVIDPYNKIEHLKPAGQSETEYISLFLDELIRFTKKHNILTFLVAHPRKIQKQSNGLHEIPTLYDINGSANFYNKTDFGVTVYRNKNTGFSEIYIQKVKFKHLGQEGMVQFKWNKYNGRYAYYDGNDELMIQEDNSIHLTTNRNE